MSRATEHIGPSAGLCTMPAAAVEVPQQNGINDLQASAKSSGDGGSHAAAAAAAAAAVTITGPLAAEFEPAAVLEAPADFARAVSEWDAVQEVVATSISEPGANDNQRVQSRRLVTFEDICEYCHTLDRTSITRSSSHTASQNAFSKFVRLLFGPPALQPSLRSEQELVYCLAALPFDDQAPFHFQLLITIYKKLTGSSIDCPRYGSHWEIIGFQGSDPATDLRGAGLLGLVNMVYFVMEPKYAQLYQKIYELSCHEIQNFPFCVVGVNLTGMALRTLRQNCLNKVCNKQGNVLLTFNDFYVWLFLCWYNIWKSGNKTIADAGFVMKELETYSRSHLNRAAIDLLSFTGCSAPAERSTDATTAPSLCCATAQHSKPYQVIDVLDCS